MGVGWGAMYHAGPAASERHAPLLDLCCEACTAQTLDGSASCFPGPRSALHNILPTLHACSTRKPNPTYIMMDQVIILSSNCSLSNSGSHASKPSSYLHNPHRQSLLRVVTKKGPLSLSAILSGGLCPHTCHLRDSDGSCTSGGWGK